MTDEERKGLEGLPVKSSEVSMFDAARSSMGRDNAGLALTWCVGIALLVVAVWGPSWILSGLGTLVVAPASWWTIARFHSSVRR